jgi:hypothetical protein
MELNELSTDKLKDALRKSISKAMSSKLARDKNKYSHLMKRFAGELAMRNTTLAESLDDATKGDHRNTDFSNQYSYQSPPREIRGDANSNRHIDSASKVVKGDKDDEIKMDLSKPLDRSWMANMHPDGVKKTINDHNQKHGTDFKDLKSAMDHGKELERMRNSYE